MAKAHHSSSLAYAATLNLHEDGLADSNMVDLPAKAIMPKTPINDALTSGQPVLTEKQRVALGGITYTPRVRAPGEALPRDINKMNSVYKPPDWTTRTGR